MQLLKNKRVLVLICGIVLLPLLPLLAGYFPATGDMRDVSIPLESFFRQEQLQGNIPSWNPAVSFGFPLIAAAQIGFFYPLLFILRFLPLYIELPVVLVVHLVAAAIGMFLFARRLKLSSEAALLATLAFVLSQFIWQHITHLNIFLAIAWFPWQMLAVHTVFQKKKIHIKDISVLAVLFGIPFLIGQLQIQLLMMVVTLCYGIYISPPHMRGSARGSVMASVFVAILALLLASVQLFPTLELTGLSSRSSSEGFDIVRANQHSYPLYHLPTLLFPRFYGNDDTYWGKRLEIEYGSYMGVIPLVLVIWHAYTVIPDLIRNLRRGSRLGGRDDEAFFFVLLFITFLLSLGSLSPFRLIGLEPSLWFFSAPARWLLFTTFAGSILAGYGFDAVWQNTQSAKKFFRNIALIIFAGIIIGNMLLFVIPMPTLIPEALQAKSYKLEAMAQSARSSSISFASPYTYIVLISLIVLTYSLSHKNGKKILLALTAVDLIIIAATTSPLVSWSNVLTPPDTISKLPESVLTHNARIYSLRDGGDTGAYFTNPHSRPTVESRELQRKLLLPMMASQFGVYGVEWPASLDLLSQSKAREVLPQGAEELGIGAILSADESGSINIEELNAKPRIEAIGGTAKIISETPASLAIQTTSNADSTLVVRDTYYPGWHAYVDGSEVQITQTEPFFRSITLPAGEHTVTMNYVPKMVYVGGAITLILLLICAIILAL